MHGFSWNECLKCGLIHRNQFQPAIYFIFWLFCRWCTQCVVLYYILSHHMKSACSEQIHVNWTGGCIRTRIIFSFSFFLFCGGHINYPKVTAQAAPTGQIRQAGTDSTGQSGNMPWEPHRRQGESAHRTIPLWEKGGKRKQKLKEWVWSETLWMGGGKPPDSQSRVEKIWGTGLDFNSNVLAKKHRIKIYMRVCV